MKSKTVLSVMSLEFISFIKKSMNVKNNGINIGKIILNGL